MKYIYIFGIIILLIKIIYAKNNNTTIFNVDKNINHNDNKNKNKEDYYLIYVNNIYEELQLYSDLDLKKRQEQESHIFIESLIEEINDLIIDNKDTYQHPEVLNELEEKSKLKKEIIKINCYSILVILMLFIQFHLLKIELFYIPIFQIN
ncbi:hypothetical protein LY90DRAFT_41320 [Neocallimastix californiae]|uniref:Uncharacterized protein n=1 Tax=Neocallimastix californiae TaxID=1754190 RepID=A0A1Y2BYD2_9FUNG|nr:hypothetical protein LY90DRAFT_41320 [Neocallimastix californiae]|eukprot:ORY39789.1 hypothetical protein LY90DRAFT_41320 [Neocallimastix californiae]